MQHTYSWLGSPLHLVLEEKIADGYNRTHLAFIEAQSFFKAKYGVPWTPELPLEMNVTSEDLEAYDQFGQLLNLLIKINGGSLDIPEEQCTSNVLVRL